MLASLATTRSGLKEIRQKTEEHLTFVNLAAFAGGMQRLSNQEKNAFHSPYLRYEAYRQAAGKHHLGLSPAGIANNVEAMDWTAPLLPRRAFSLSDNDGRKVSKSSSVEDTAKAYLLKMILEAEWENCSEPYSYGVLSRGVADAIGDVAEYLYEHPMWYFKTDIKACFASVDHSHLAADLKMKLTRYMWAKLQPHLVATLEDNQNLWCPETGITTGSPLSALVLDIYLKDLGREVTEGYEEAEVRFFRYIDDILILSPDINALRQCESRLQGWVEQAGLELSTAKTSIGTTAAIIDERMSYDVGHVGQYPEFAVPVKPGVVFLGARISHYLDPEGETFETWIELEVPKEKISWKNENEEEKKAYKQAIKNYIRNIRSKVNNKAFVGSWLTHEYQLPVVPEEIEVGRKEHKRTTSEVGLW